MADSMIGPQEPAAERLLFGGAISCAIPIRFQDVSDIREVPNNQEAFVDVNRDESIIIELLELKEDVNDQQSALWFLQDLASEQDVGQDLVSEFVNPIDSSSMPFIDSSIAKTTAIAQMAISKGRQGADARNIVRVYLGNIRLRNVGTDVLITVYEPLHISEHSQSAAAVGAGETVPAAIMGYMPAQTIFQYALATFKILDWSLFG